MTKTTRPKKVSAESGTEAGRQYRCFVISPIGSVGSDIRMRANMFLEYVVKAGLSGLPFHVKRADDDQSGLITQAIFDDIISADLIVADLSGHNANVFYELGVAHTRGKAIAHFKCDDLQIPFDITDFQTFAVNLSDVSSHKQGADHLRGIASRVIADEYKPENPVTRADHLRAVRSGETRGDKNEVRLAEVERKLGSLSQTVAGLKSQPNVDVLTRALIANNALSPTASGLVTRIGGVDPLQVSAFQVDALGRPLITSAGGLPGGIFDPSAALQPIQIAVRDPSQPPASAALTSGHSKKP